VTPEPANSLPFLIESVSREKEDIKGRRKC